MKHLLLIGVGLVLEILPAGAFPHLDPWADQLPESQTVGGFTREERSSFAVKPSPGRSYYDPILLTDFTEEGDILALTGGVDWSERMLADFFNGPHFRISADTGSDQSEEIESAVERSRRLPVPEPSSLMIAVLGLCPILFRKRRS